MHHFSSGLLDLKFEELVPKVNLPSSQSALVEVVLVIRCTSSVRGNPLFPVFDRIEPGCVRLWGSPCNPLFASHACDPKNATQLCQRLCPCSRLLLLAGKVVLDLLQLSTGQRLARLLPLDEKSDVLRGNLT